jgi:hypothetical protein
MTHRKTEKERRAERQATYDRLNRPEVLAIEDIMNHQDWGIINPDMWGRYATNKEKAAALYDAGYRLVEPPNTDDVWPPYDH